jgi:putative redox protein
MTDTFTNEVDCATTNPGDYPQTLQVRTHTLHADVGSEAGSTDSAPSPHDYFDAALASCKALTATWYAKRHDIPLERVATRVERDSREERLGKYRLRVHLDFQGPLTDAQRETLREVVEKCPIHKLMTQVTIDVETVV